jgi:hypothetical protein
MIRLRRDMVRIGLEVGAILNTVEDDDDRDELHGVLEKTLNDDLFAGATARSSYDLPDLLARSVSGVDADVIDLASYSKRVGR